VGSFPVGGGAPVSIQSMTNTLTFQVHETVTQLQRLKAAGCDIARISIPDGDALKAFEEIRKQIHIPLIADIHYDYRLAIGAMRSGADGIRINPGNIGRKQKVRALADVARELKIPIRVGVNLGSVKKELLDRFAHDRVGALVENARQWVEMFEEMGVNAMKVSLKSSDVVETIDAYRRFAQISPWPLHVGVTESGPLYSGLIRSSVGIGVLLHEGIGDTIRVSLSADPVEEVFAARMLLECLALRKEGIRVIACPTCARANADVAAIATELENALKEEKRHMIVAVMGCSVNGPGEARIADIGIACDRKGALLFSHGKILRRIRINEIVDTILEEIQKETP